MKKIFMLAVAACLVTGAAFAQDGAKKKTEEKACCKKDAKDKEACKKEGKDKECCKKGAKEGKACCKKDAKTEAKKS